MEEFQCKTTIYSGPGAVSALAGMGGERLMLVTDPFFMKNGTAQRIAQTAKCAQVEYFDKVQPDPSVELAAEGTARLKEFAPDLLVALGGGSAMDCAKAMAYFAKGNYKLVAIPTPSGSEVTDFAILTHNKVKHPLVDKRLRPDAAILDSDLLQELPKGLIAETGFDALSHAVEAYAAKNAGVMTDLYAREAFSSAFAAFLSSGEALIHNTFPHSFHLENPHFSLGRNERHPFNPGHGPVPAVWPPDVLLPLAQCFSPIRTAKPDFSDVPAARKVERTATHQRGQLFLFGYADRYVQVQPLVPVFFRKSPLPVLL